MKINETIGIDVSKLTIDVCIHSNKSFHVFKNSNEGFKKMVKWVLKKSLFLSSETLYIFEHTGMYSVQLSIFLTNSKRPFTIVPGLEIKRSLGISRGKDDKIDAFKIALYGYRLRDEIKPSVIPTNQIMELKRLFKLRERLVKQRAGFKSSLKEQKRVFTKKENQCLFETQEKMIRYLSKQITILDQKMNEIIKSNDSLRQIYNLLLTIKSVGKQTALIMIIYTNAFTKFKNARKFASYCGIAPFPNKSGTSLKGRTKISNLANKSIKSILDMSAKSAIQHNTEMKNYYNNRIEKGKNKRSTINIIRNKIVARIFAVVQRKTPYVDFFKYAA